MPLMLLQPGGWFKAHNATVIADVTVGSGSSVWFSCVIRGDVAPIRIGEGTNVQDGAVIHCDTGFAQHIGNFVTIGHRAMLHGERIGDRALIGMGAVILGHTEIGDEAIVAAGCVVKEGMKVPPRTIVAGVPGKILREITELERERLLGQALRYRYLAQMWAEHEVVTPAMVKERDDREGLKPFQADKNRT